MFSGKKVVVTGGAGFIGSHLVDLLVSEGAQVTVIDNLSTGRMEFISKHDGKNGFHFVKADLLSPDSCSKNFRDCFAVFHLASSSDIKKSNQEPRTDLEQGTVATFNVLELMRKHDVRNFVFSSSCAVYGENLKNPIKETDGPAIPISLYGASKLAAEGLAGAYAGTYGLSSLVYRFANVVGPRSTHGAVFDFCKKLRANPSALEVLGDGRQTKSYFLAGECAEAIVFGASKVLPRLSAGTEIFNIANSDWISVREIAEIVVKASGLNGVKINYTGGSKGWPGDVPKIMLDGSKLARLGWSPKLNSKESVRKAARLVWRESKKS